MFPRRAKGSGDAYLVISNDQRLPVGTYQGKWTISSIAIDSISREIHTDVSISGTNIPVRLEVTKSEIKIYL